MRKLLALALLLLSPTLSWSLDQALEAKIGALLGRMTLEEKLGQLQQLGGPGTQPAPPNYSEAARKGRLGSVLTLLGSKNINELQKAALESRLKIPILFGFDVIHGYRTIFPMPLAEAASWEPSLAEKAAEIAAAEAYAAGVRWTFAPMVDIARDPRWGRIMEGSGEDPYLGSVFAAARVRGFQGTDYSEPGRLAACAKHWAAYGAAEAGRDYNTADVSERTLREVYFPPFKAAVDAGVATFMSAFNDLDGLPASANPWTLTQVLRKEWGFEGFVVSDYESIKELIKHGVAADAAGAALAALPAGVDMEMVSDTFMASVPTLVQQGELSMETVNEAVRRVLRIKMRLGLFERPFAEDLPEAETMKKPEYLAAAKEAADKSLVLLKNDGPTLPFTKDLKTLVVVGPLAADTTSMLGWWAGDGKPEDAITLLDGLRRKLPTASVKQFQGCDIDCLSDGGFAEAVEAAKSADAVVLALGESYTMSGEAASRSSIDLPGHQLELALAVLAAGKPTAVVLFNGRPMTLSKLHEKAPAILEAWFPGTMGGHSVADALFGDVNPGGKLPSTFPRNLGQVPLYYNHKNTGRPALNPTDRYLSKYIDSPNAPLYPFGWGLSYTTFALKDLSLDQKTIPPSGSIQASVTVENTGPVAGDEVVQLYIRDAVSSVSRPVRELKGFQRVTLKPGEQRRVGFALGPKELGAYDQEMRWKVEPGTFQVFAGTSSAGGLEASFDVLSK